MYDEYNCINIIVLSLERFEADNPVEENHLQAVGGGHGPGQPEHLVLLAILHNTS